MKNAWILEAGLVGFFDVVLDFGFGRVVFSDAAVLFFETTGVDLGVYEPAFAVFAALFFCA